MPSFYRNFLVRLSVWLVFPSRHHPDRRGHPLMGSRPLKGGLRTSVAEMLASHERGPDVAGLLGPSILSQASPRSRELSVHEVLHSSRQVLAGVNALLFGVQSSKGKGISLAPVMCATRSSFRCSTVSIPMANRRALPATSANAAASPTTFFVKSPGAGARSSVPPLTFHPLRWGPRGHCLSLRRPAHGCSPARKRHIPRHRAVQDAPLI